MGKRPLDAGELGRMSTDEVAGTMSTDNVVKKSERSHEENQERAYIAASRRGDRSLEARLQSARMASEVHRKRTGKGFKITEEIVMNEEMYEEEDDDFPRFRRYHRHPQAGSHDRVDAFLMNQASWESAARAARAAEIDRLFAEQFPGAARIHQPYLHQQVFPPGYSTSMHHPHGYNPPHQPYPGHERTLSMPHIPPQSQSPSPFAQQSPILPVTRHASFDEQNPPGLTPGSTRTDTPFSNITPPDYPLEDPHCSPQVVGFPLDPSLGVQHPTPHFSPDYTFTKSTAGPATAVDAVSPIYTGEGLRTDDSNLYADAKTDRSAYSPRPQPFSNLEFDATINPPELPGPVGVGAPDSDYLDTFDASLGESGTHGSRIGTPGGGMGDSWENWIVPDADMFPTEPGGV